MSLKRANAVWDLTDIPSDTPFQVQITVEIGTRTMIDNQQTVSIPLTIDSLDTVRNLASKMAIFTTQSKDSLTTRNDKGIDLYHRNTHMHMNDYMYTYQIRDGDIIHAVLA